MVAFLATYPQGYYGQVILECVFMNKLLIE